MNLVFDDSMKTDVSEVDAQHKAMFKMINEFQDSCRQSVSRQKLIELFDFLNGYVMEHFLYEEAYMESISYSELEVHRKKHALLTDQAKQFEAKLKQESIDEEGFMEFNNFLSKWLIDHIIVEDTKFKLYKRQDEIKRKL